MSISIENIVDAHTHRLFSLSQRIILSILGLNYTMPAAINNIDTQNYDFLFVFNLFLNTHIAIFSGAQGVLRLAFGNSEKQCWTTAYVFTQTVGIIYKQWLLQSTLALKYYKKESVSIVHFLPKASCCHFVPYSFVIVSWLSLKYKWFVCF